MDLNSFLYSINRYRKIKSKNLYYTVILKKVNHFDWQPRISTDWSFEKLLDTRLIYYIYRSL